MPIQSLRQLIDIEYPELEPKMVDEVVKFYELLLEENVTQNLTRQTDPIVFLKENIGDAVALLRTFKVSKKVIDIGSGGGLPALLCAILDKKSFWVLTESEIRKAEFLRGVIIKLGLKNIKSCYSRGEEVVVAEAAVDITVRAVGPILKVLNLLKNCSTWNSLFLFKGPKWKEEWVAAKNQAKTQGVHLCGAHEYTASYLGQTKKRAIIHLKRR